MAQTFPAPLAFECTPDSLLKSTPCVACLSEHELLAVIVGILSLAASKTVAEAMSDSACFTCLSDKQLLQALVVKIGNDALGEEHTVSEVVDQFHCLVCATPKQLKAAIIQLLCANFTLSIQQ